MNLATTQATIVSWRCSCALCSLNFEGVNFVFPQDAEFRPDLHGRFGIGSPEWHGVYTPRGLKTEDEYRALVRGAGWLVVTVSRDGGVNTSEVAICPTCILVLTSAGKGDAA